MEKFDLEVINSLRELEIGVHLRGYTLIKTAMNLLHENPRIIHTMMKLYTKVGELHDSSPTKVERNIRHALESAESDNFTQKKVIGTARDLTNAEFLATLHEAIVIKLASEKCS